MQIIAQEKDLTLNSGTAVLVFFQPRSFFNAQLEYNIKRVEQEETGTRFYLVNAELFKSLVFLYKVTRVPEMVVICNGKKMESSWSWDYITFRKNVVLYGDY